MGEKPGDGKLRPPVDAWPGALPAGWPLGPRSEIDRKRRLPVPGTTCRADRPPSRRPPATLIGEAGVRAGVGRTSARSSV